MKRAIAGVFRLVELVLVGEEFLQIESQSPWPLG
jgi:hypothetical protein